MKPIHKWLIGGVSIIALIAVGLFIYGYRMFSSEVPPKNETLTLPGLQKPVEVIFDKWGVPHVFGGSDLDMVRALGYLHARDRLWQMDLTRRAASGRLSEIFGEPLYETDVFQRTIGLGRIGANQKADPETTALLQAYCDGINQFIKTHPARPTIEFRMIGYDMEPWKPSDVATLARMTGWNLSANWNEELMRQALVNERGADAAWALMPRHSDPGPYIIPPEERKYGQGARLERKSPIKTASYDMKGIYRLLEIGDNARKTIGAIASSEFASNSWVVSPKKSASGGAMLCNDPHLDLLLPSVWHEAHLVGDNFNVAGVSFPGTPFIVLGHNQKAAWGATTTVADTQDLYILTINKDNPNQYLYNGEWENFTTIEEKIKVRKSGGFDEKALVLRISRHGPVITDLPDMPKGLPTMALRWAGYENTNEAKAIMDMAKATSWQDFLKALDGFKVPIQNWVYADVNGDIGYIANGLLPVRGKGDGTLPVPGDDPEYEWKGYVPQAELPQLLNPSSGYIATANNKVVPEKDYPYVVSFRYAAPYRAMRITEVLNSEDKFNIQDMSDLQMDNKLMLGQRLLKYFLNAYDKKGDKSDGKVAEMVEELKKWDFLTPTTSRATLFFLETYRQAFRLTYEDEMSEELFKSFREDRSPWNGFDNAIETDANSTLFDDRRTKEVETRDDILAKAFSEATKQLTTDMGDNPSNWVWGKRHIVLFNHPLGQIDILRKIFSRGPYELAGARDTVNNGFFNWFLNPYMVWEGPSLRHVADFGNVENSRMTTTVGQSGHRLSPHYSDQVKDWLNGGSHPMPMTREGVSKIAEGTVKFTP